MRNRLHCLTLSALACGLAIGLAACGTKTVESDPPPAPAPAYTGPDFLKTSIGSMTTIRGYQSQLVSGYGLVVGLDGTGSAQVPPALRAWLINEMTRQGFGREGMGYGELTPRRVLASEDTAVVLVEGVIPPGAVKGTTFDVSVAALPQTETTSLAGGRLYTTDLRIAGSNPRLPSSEPLARAGGDVFTNPFIAEDPGTAEEAAGANPRVGRLLGGGVAIKDSLLVLVLNQPSYQRAGLIAERLNGRFQQAPADPQPIAIAKSDRIVQINVLQRFRGNPKRMLELASALFLNPTDRYNQEKAREMVEQLKDPANHRWEPQIILAWEAMGKTALPVLRDYYEASDPVLNMAVLEAAARLNDLDALERLHLIAISAQGPRAARATDLLGKLLIQNPRHRDLTMLLRDQLDHADAMVRFAAFDALSTADDPAVNRRVFDHKLELAFVRSARPLIYVTRSQAPRIVVFGEMLGFNTPLAFNHDDGRLMLRQDRPGQPLAVRGRPRGADRGTTEEIAPTVANLVYLLANRPTRQNFGPGLDMGYGEIVKVLHRLTEQGAIDAPLVLQPSDLEQRITAQRMAAGSREYARRPETPEGDAPTVSEGSSENRRSNIVRLPGSGDN